MSFKRIHNLYIRNYHQTKAVILRNRRSSFTMAKFSIRNVELHVEIPALLLFFAFMSANSVTTNLVMYRTCSVTLNYSESDCALLGTDYSDNATAELEKVVQPHATKLFMTLAIMEALVPPLLCFFLGPWSDTYGRRPLMLSTIGGCVIAFILVSIISAIPGASPWLLLFFLIPSCLSGGIPTLMTLMICYIIDVTKEEQRGVRMALLQGVMAFGTILGTFSSSFILNTFGYVTVYAIGTVCTILALLYTYYFLPESVENARTKGRFRNLFRLSLIKSAFEATIKKREYYKRAMLLSVILVMTIAAFTTFGDAAVLFLYLRRKLQWTLQTFTVYSSVNNAIGIAGGIIGVLVLHKFLHVKEAFIMLIGFISLSCGSLIQGLATADWYLYLAGSVKSLSGSISPMARCLISKLVTPEDSGKVFSVLTALDTASVQFGAFAYTAIYNATLINNPAAFNFVSCGMYAFEIILVVAVLMMQRYHKQMEYKTFENESTA